MSETVWKIYKTTCLVNGKVYIGQTIKEGDALKRYLGSGNIIRLAIKKHKRKNFTKQILITCNSQSVSNEYESLFIELYSSTDRSIGYNVFSTGDHDLVIAARREIEKRGGKGFWFGKKFSDETRKRMSQSSMGVGKGKIISEKQRRLISERMSGSNHPFYGMYGPDHPSYGKKLTEEARMKMSISRTGDGNHFKGKHHTLEVKELISKIRSGTKSSESTIAKLKIINGGARNNKAIKIESYNPETGHTTKVFGFIKEAMLQFNIKSRKKINRILADGSIVRGVCLRYCK